VDAEESRHLGGSIAVIGRVPGWRAPWGPWRRVLSAYLQGLGLPWAGVTLRLVGDLSSRRLNALHRKIDAPTDILSFPAQEGRAPRGFDGYLGDLALDLPYAWRQRGRFAKTFDAELAFLALHGLLHLTGRHHDSPKQEASHWRLSRRLHPLGGPHWARLARKHRA
jgi:probable rRNA maturation factor